MLKSKIKILIADDHKLFRSGIVKLLGDQPNIFVIGEAENGAQLVEKYFELLPDIVLTDIAMPNMSGLEAVATIKKKDPGLKALFLSMYDSDEYIYKAFKSGGTGLVNKNILEGELHYAIEKVYNGEKYFRGKLKEDDLKKLIEEFESNKELSSIPINEITYREEQILKLLNEGLSSKEMAERLNLSKKTIDFYRSNLMRKFNLRSSVDLIRFAVNYFNIEEGKNKFK
jgi:DNA-binding NarL/FixJ family response regulator